MLAGLALASTAYAQKKVVKSEDDLPRFNYPIDGTATALLQSDDATFNLFANRVRNDVDSLLTDYDIQDHATLRDILNVRVSLQLLAGDDKAALATLDQTPQPRRQARRQTSQRPAHARCHRCSCLYWPDFRHCVRAAFAKAYAASLEPLPWAIVGNRIKEAKSSAEIVSPALRSGQCPGRN